MDTNTIGIVSILIIELVLGFLISWSIGLLPAIIYRYIIYKKPIDKKDVFWRLAPAVIIMALTFKLTNAAYSGEIPSANPIPWIVIYYIGRWIMTRTPRLNNRKITNSICTESISSELESHAHQPNVTNPHLAQSAIHPPSDATMKRLIHRCLLVFLIALILVVIAVPIGMYYSGKALINNAKESMEKTPLYLAVATNNVAEVDRLLADGEDPNEKALRGHSPLIMAARCDYSIIAEHLLKAGANPNQKDNLQWAPLHHAIKTDNANIDIISILVRYGADVNITDKHLRTPLHRAAQYGHFEAVRLLLNLKANPEAKDKNGWTPLDRGAAHPAVLELLEGL